MMSTDTMIVQVHYCPLFLILTLAPQKDVSVQHSDQRLEGRPLYALSLSHGATVACALSLHCFQFRTQLISILMGNLTGKRLVKRLVFKASNSYLIRPLAPWLSFTIQSNAADTSSLHTTTCMRLSFLVTLYSRVT